MTDESKVALELRRHYDLQKRKLDEMQAQRDAAQKQLKQVLGVFATHKKALEMSIMKNKRLEQEIALHKSKTSELEDVNFRLKQAADQLEKDNQAIAIKYKK